MLASPIGIRRRLVLELRVTAHGLEDQVETSGFLEGDPEAINVEPVRTQVVQDRPAFV
jgi:hypothetical protein